MRVQKIVKSPSEATSPSIHNRRVCGRSRRVGRHRMSSSPSHQCSTNSGTLLGMPLNCMFAAVAIHA